MKMDSNGHGKRKCLQILSVAADSRYTRSFSINTTVELGAGSPNKDLEAAHCNAPNRNLAFGSRLIMNCTVRLHRLHSPSNKTIRSLLCINQQFDAQRLLSVVCFLLIVYFR